jgi:hypothetical protein
MRSHWIKESDLLWVPIVVGVAMLLMTPQPALSGEHLNGIPVLTDSDLPMDGDFTEDPSSDELAPLSAVIDIMSPLAEDWQGFFYKQPASVAELLYYIVCIDDDDICVGPLTWQGLQFYQDADPRVLVEGSAEYSAKLIELRAGSRVFSHPEWEKMTSTSSFTVIASAE